MQAATEADGLRWRILVAICTVALAFSCTFGVPAAQAFADDLDDGQASPGCALSSADDVKPGDTVTLEFSIDYFEDGVEAAQLDSILFDADALEILSIERGELIPAEDFDGYVSPNPSFGWTSLDGIKGPGVAAKLTFKVKDDTAPGTYSIQVEEGEIGCFGRIILEPFETIEYNPVITPGYITVVGDDPDPADTYDWDSTTWAGGLDFTWYDASDVKSEYHLTTPAQWEALAWICSERLADLADYATATDGNVKAIRGTVPSEQNVFTGVKFYLDNDIDMGGARGEDGTWTSDFNYYPIGTSCASDLAQARKTDPIDSIWYSIFSGSFDGQGHIVKNVYSNRLGASFSDSQHVALFGRVGAADNTTRPSTDIVIENVAVTGYFNGGRSCGGVVGKTLSVASGYSVKVRNCLNFADVKTNNGAKGVGGVVGALWNGGTVDNSANFGSVTGTYRTANAAGVSGAAEAGTTNSYNVGKVVNTATATNAGAVALNQSAADVVNCWALEGTCPGYTSSIVNGNRLVSGGWMSEADMKTDDFARKLAEGGGTWVFPNENDSIYAVMQAAGVLGYPVPQVFSTSEPPAEPYQITTQPVDATAALKQTAEFRIETNDEDAVYRWEYSEDGGDTWAQSYLTGWKTSEFSFAVTAARADRLYRCKVTFSDGTVEYSDTVSVVEPKADESIKVTATPEKASVKLKDTVEFKAAVEGVEDASEYTFLWYYSEDNGENWAQSYLGGWKTDTFTFAVTSPRAERIYRVKATAPSGAEIFSEPVSIELASDTALSV